VTIDQVPAEVKKAILREVGNGRLVDITEHSTGSKKYYEIEMIKDGREIDVYFDSDGTVMKRASG
jgi:uncharacterized membrane protein YkoI